MIYTQDDLRNHIGHKIVCVRYGQGEVLNVALECEDCNVVLVDFDNGDTISKELADDAGKTIAHIWHVNDIMLRARERHVNLSDQQCLEILQLIDRGLDASVGINWDVIDTTTDDYLADQQAGANFQTMKKLQV